MPAVLQAQAWLALGSMSLVDEPLCRNTTPLLVAELKRNAAPAVRANAMLALSDIAAVQTMLVDVHLKDITVAVRDPHPLLRKQALSLLAGLLQKEFLKWRGPLFVQCAPACLVVGAGWLVCWFVESGFGVADRTINLRGPTTTPRAYYAPVGAHVAAVAQDAACLVPGFARDFACLDQRVPYWRYVLNRCLDTQQIHLQHPTIMSGCFSI